MSEQNEFHKLIDGLILLNKSLRERYKDEYYDISSIMHAIEFRTISCDIGRQAGKTEYIKRNAKKGDLVIVHNNMHKTRFKDISCDVFTSHDLSIFKGRLSFKTIYIDEPCLVFRNRQKIDELYEILVSRDPEQTFVFLGRS